MTGASVVLICPTCESRWRHLTDDERSSTALVPCPNCGQPATILETAAAAWALGHISRGDFFEFAGHLAPEDVGEALTALVNIATWWEQRTSDQSSDEDHPHTGDVTGPC